MKPDQIFDDIYSNKKWGDGSGGGSDPAVCAPYCRLVEWIIEERNIKRVLDLGCGDGRVAAYIDWRGVYYVGIDCSRECPNLAVQYPTWNNHEILIRDILADPLPVASYFDLVLLKEVTQHLPNADVIRLMERLKDYPLVLHCSGYDGPFNVDIAMGETRPVDLALPPFGLPAKTILTYGGGYTCQLLGIRA